MNYRHPPKPYWCEVAGDIAPEGGSETERGDEINFVQKQHQKSSFTNPRLFCSTINFANLIKRLLVQWVRRWPAVALVCSPGTESRMGGREIEKGNERGACRPANWVTLKVGERGESWVRCSRGRVTERDAQRERESRRETGKYEPQLWPWFCFPFFKCQKRVF